MGHRYMDQGTSTRNQAKTLKWIGRNIQLSGNLHSTPQPRTDHIMQERISKQNGILNRAKPGWYLVPGTWYQVPGTWYLETRYLVLSVRRTPFAGQN